MDRKARHEMQAWQGSRRHEGNMRMRQGLSTYANRNEEAMEKEEGKQGEQQGIWNGKERHAQAVGAAQHVIGATALHGGYRGYLCR
eukprot:759174-Hanusia_phi.AAC.1